MTENTLRARLSRPPILIAPGVYDPLTALIAEQAGFEALYVSGAAIAYTRLGRPDIGLVSMSEVVDTVALIRDRVARASRRRRRHRLRQRAQCRAHRAPAGAGRRECHPDRGSGFSQALRPSRRQGADPGAEMVGKIKAALDARRSRETLDHRPHRRRRRRRLRPRDRARRALSRGGRRYAVRRGAARARRARPHRRADGQGHAADGQHGGGRQDADRWRRPNCRRSALPSSSSPAASCARWPRRPRSSTAR